MKTKILSVGVFTVLSASSASADPITIPSGLAPGSTYYLAFVTEGVRDATSSNIADYDAFVTADANGDPTLAALGTTWIVIGSTATVDAIRHIGDVNGPIYNLAGQEVATGTAALFSGSLGAPIAYSRGGDLLQSSVLTGTAPTGLAGTSQQFGGHQLGAALPTIGNDVLTDAGWIDYSYTTEQQGLRFYGISGPLTVPSSAPVPEPSTLSLMLGPAFLLLARLRTRRNRSAALASLPW